MNSTLEKIRPETIALLEANAMRRGMTVDEYLQSLLPIEAEELAMKADANRNASSESEAAREAKRQKSIDWIKTHRQDYGGLYVALDGDQLIVAGKKYFDVRSAAIQQGFHHAFIGDVLPIGYEGFLEGIE